MVFTKGSRVCGQDRPWLTEDHIRKMITTKVATTIQSSIPKLFESTKTTMIELFDEH